MDFGEPATKPTLTEPGVKNFLNQALKQSHIIREKFHNTIFNIDFTHTIRTLITSCSIVKMIERYLSYG